MPTLHTCVVCGTLTTNQFRRCDDHKRKPDTRPQWSKHRDSVRQQRFRQALLDRTRVGVGHRCERCSHVYEAADMRAAHYPVPLRAYDRADTKAYAPENGLLLCAQCDRALDPHAR